MLLAAKLRSESAPRHQPNVLRVFSVWFFETMRMRRKAPQNRPFIEIQSGEPTGTVWWRWLRSSGFVAIPAELAIESVSIKACKIKVID